MVVSVARAIGPVFSTSLFAASMQNPQLLGGNMVYWVLTFLTLFATLMSRRLPTEPWREPEENEMQALNDEDRRED
jgi:hypothetical protein